MRRPPTLVPRGRSRQFILPSAAPATLESLPVPEAPGRMNYHTRPRSVTAALRTAVTDAGADDTATAALITALTGEGGPECPSSVVDEERAMDGS